MKVDESTDVRKRGDFALLSHIIHKFSDEFGRHPERLRDSFSSPYRNRETARYPDKNRDKAAQILHPPNCIISL